MATRHIDDKLRCPHCLEELDYLEEPKQLPCSHIYCLPCLIPLTVINLTGVQVTCSICSKEHQITDLSSLSGPQTEVPETEVENCDTGNGETEGKLADSNEKCDRCTNGNTAAACYCRTCEKRLCLHHEKLHQDYFNGEELEHKLVSIQNFEKTPGVYTKPKCPKHGLDLAMCCQKCFSFRCHQCQTNDQCTKTSQQHSFRSLIDTSVQVKMDFEVLLKKCSEKMTEFCKLEKQTWQKVDTLDEMCGAMYQEVETRTDELMKLVREESKLAIGRVRNFENAERQQIEAHATNIRVKRENLGTLTRSCGGFLKSNNIVDICRGKDEKLSHLEKNGSEVIAEKAWSMQNPKDLILSFKELRPRVLPLHIHILSTHSTDGQCHCTHFCEDGSVLLGTSSGIYVHNDDCSQPQIKNTRRQITSIDSHDSEEGNREYFFIAHRYDSRSVHYTTDFLQPKQHFSYNFPGNRGAFLTVSASALAVTAENSIEIYNKKGKKMFVKKLHYHPEQLYFNNNSLLVSGNNQLRKYQLAGDEKDMSLIWSCEELTKSGGVCMTKNGLIIVVAGGDKDCLYLVSEGGERLGTLRHEELRPYTDGSISISDQGILPVPYWAKNTYKLFQIM